ncbi:MAG: hypothetical protein KC621_05685 [Myxococcales bacterium]|nr:hypothetical protein [Myxococcales bacterium]
MPVMTDFEPSIDRMEDGSWIALSRGHQALFRACEPEGEWWGQKRLRAVCGHQGIGKRHAIEWVAGRITAHLPPAVRERVSADVRTVDLPCSRQPTAIERWTETWSRLPDILSEVDELGPTEAVLHLRLTERPLVPERSAEVWERLVGWSEQRRWPLPIVSALSKRWIDDLHRVLAEANPFDGADLVLVVPLVRWTPEVVRQCLSSPETGLTHAARFLDSHVDAIDALIAGHPTLWRNVFDRATTPIQQPDRWLLDPRGPLAGWFGQINDVLHRYPALQELLDGVLEDEEVLRKSTRQQAALAEAFGLTVVDADRPKKFDELRPIVRQWWSEQRGRA